MGCGREHNLTAERGDRQYRGLEDLTHVSLDALRTRHQDWIKCARLLSVEMPVGEDGERARPGCGSHQTTAQPDLSQGRREGE